MRSGHGFMESDDGQRAPIPARMVPQAHGLRDAGRRATGDEYRVFHRHCPRKTASERRDRLRRDGHPATDSLS